MDALTARFTEPFTESHTHNSLREQGTREQGAENKGTLQDQTSQLTTAHAFGDWPWT